MTRTIVVDHEQVESARALIKIMGGPDKVDPLIRKIAEAPPRRRVDVEDLDFVVEQPD
jgi:hypothetical protein